MRTIKSHKMLSTIVAIAIAASAVAVGLGVAAGSRANAQPAAIAVDPRIGDYERAQRDLEQHLDQRLRLHLAQASQAAGRR
ncbi:MAG: hypothetical protein JXR83_03290 [Deltaproteobacteria bacterium]|nr:hypothetical protein [Deltaproteobacteria bacterium]